MSALGDLVRRDLRGLPPYVPGTSVGEVRRRFGIATPVKLSQNENPLGTSPRALAALHGVAALSAYVEDDHTALRERLAAPYGLDPRAVLLGHGSNELVALLCSTFVEPGQGVVIADPTFSLYAKYARVAGAAPTRVPLRDGVHDLGAMLAAVDATTKLVFVCDPNNPTGTRVRRDALLAFARALPKSVLLVVDQAYVEYADGGALDAVDVLRERPATVVLRTASKIFGLAAVRFGYGYADPEIVSATDRVRVPFNVSRPAAAAVLAALDDADFIARSRANNAAGLARLDAAFAELGVEAYPSAANFVAVTVPVPADEAYQALLRRGIIVRSGDGLGMPGRLRVTVGKPEELDAFLAAFGELLALWRGTAASASASASAVS